MMQIHLLGLNNNTLGQQMLGQQMLGQQMLGQQMWGQQMPNELEVEAPIKICAGCICVSRPTLGEIVK